MFSLVATGSGFYSLLQVGGAFNHITRERVPQALSWLELSRLFFSDLVGFTETTERLDSEDLTRLLNQYLTEMSQIAVAHGASYRVLDLYEKLDEADQAIRTRLPHFHLDVDPALMSAEE